MGFYFELRLLLTYCNQIKLEHEESLCFNALGLHDRSSTRL